MEVKRQTTNYTKEKEKNKKNFKIEVGKKKRKSLSKENA